MILTPGKAVAIGWLQNWWRHRSRAERVAVEYQEMQTDKPLVLADLARFCNAFDSCLDEESQRRTDANLGRQEVWLHIVEMMNLDPVDLQNLKEVTEQ